MLIYENHICELEDEGTFLCPQFTCMIFIYLQLFIHNFMDLFGEGGGREEWRKGGGGREGGGSC